jgi:hypothetical protein
MFKRISQEHQMGCAVACVASRCGLKYSEALKLFSNHHFAWTRGFYCSEIVSALSLAGFNYIYQIFNAGHKNLLKEKGTIVFVEPSENI